MKNFKFVLMALLLISASFADKEGFNEDGSCDGQILFFDGQDYQCESAYRVAGVSVNNCCNGNMYSQITGHCKKESNNEYAGKNEQKLCVTIGEYCVEDACITKIPYWDLKGNKKYKCVGKFCKSTYRGSCCFSTKISRIIHQQGRPQIKRGWGTAQSPDCRGFTPDEFQKLDFSKIDLSEYINDVQSKMKIDGVDTGDVEQKIKDKIDKFY